MVCEGGGHGRRWRVEVEGDLEGAALLGEVEALAVGGGDGRKLGDTDGTTLRVGTALAQYRKDQKSNMNRKKSKHK